MLLPATRTNPKGFALQYPAGELPHIQAVNRLNKKNYLKWSQLIRTVLKGKEKIDHLQE